MAGLRPGTLRGEDHWSRTDHTHAAPTNLTTANIVTAVPGAIAPDDTANLGASTSLSRADHRHAFTSGAASALTKTASSGEGSGSSHARADHVHATSALPWGIVGRFTSTSSSAAYTDGQTTDFSLSVTVDSTRLYRVHLHSSDVNVSATGNHAVEFYVGGVNTQRVAFIDTITGLDHRPGSWSWLWTPSSATVTVDLRVVLASGTMTFVAAAANPRWFWVEDIGLR